MRKVKKEVKEKERKVSLQVDVFVLDGDVDEVKQSAHLGNQPMLQNEDGVYECVGVYNRPNSKVKVSFDLVDLGTVVPKYQIVEGMHEVDVKFDGLALLDEPEKVEALSDDELELLEDVGTMELRKLFEGWTPEKHTPLQDAAIAIYQHPEGSRVIMEHNMEETVGDHTDGADAYLVVGDHEFEAGGKFWSFCAYKECKDKRSLYRFTWMGVPESYLNEQE
jgi:hypothetical protein